MNIKSNFIQNNIVNILNFYTSNNKSDSKYIINLVNVYPNVLNLMLNNIIPDLSNVKLVKETRYKTLMKKIQNNRHIIYLCDCLKYTFPLSFLQRLYNSAKGLESNKNQNNYQFIDKLIFNLKLNPYKMVKTYLDISFKRLDKILINSYDECPEIWNFNLKISIVRCEAFVEYYLSTQLNGSTFCSINQLYNDMIYKFNLYDCINIFDTAIQNKTLFKILKNKSGVYKYNIMLAHVYNVELYISNYIKKALNFKIENTWLDIDKNVNNYRKLDNFELTDIQISLLHKICNNQLVLLNGFAGSGKSSIIKALINMLEDYDKTFLMLAPTGKAAKVLQNYTNRHTQTIHKLLYTMNEHFRNTLDYDIIIIEESSMISISLFYELIDKINIKHTKIIMIGDSYQLPSIDSGNLYQDLLKINEIEKISLNEIFRYKENGLINVSTNIRLGQQYLTNSHEIIGESYIFTEYKDVYELINNVLNLCVKLNSENQEFVVLTPKNIGNTGTYVINSCIQQVINNNDFNETYTIRTDNQKITFKVNDKVLNIKNDYKAKYYDEYHQICDGFLVNGDIGVIKDINNFNSTIIVTIDNKDYIFSNDDINNLRLAYCFTIHKSQGSQFDNVIMITTDDDSFMINSNLLYVGVTRAKYKCYHFGSKNVINNKIDEHINLERNTTLCKHFYNLI